MINTRKNRTANSFLQRLKKDAAGNTIAIMAAALVPLVGLIGGGVDASRGYMVKTRLQQACDAGVLAGRKAVGDGTFDTNARNRAVAFFDANFPANFQSSKNTTFTPASSNGGGLVTGVARTEMPTVLMQVFGFASIDLEVDCQALLTISNSDVTMVLDTTGSMRNSISDGAGGTTTRIAALRSAMVDFYDILDNASSSSLARIRYGLVPYSGTVNVGQVLLNTDPDFLVSGNNSYQTRRAVFEVDGPPGFSTTTTNNQFFQTLTQVDGPECTDRFSQNQSIPGYWTASPSGNPVVTTTTVGQTTTTITRTYSYFSWNGSQAQPPANAIGSNFWLTCVRQVDEVTEVTAPTPSRIETFDPSSGDNPAFKHWLHIEHDWDVSPYIASIGGGTSVPIPSDRFGATATWAGCIEERDTLDSDNIAFNTGSGSITPAGAQDLDIDSAPSSDATRWRPYWPEVSFSRASGTNSEIVTNETTSNNFTFNSGKKSQTACPSPSQLLSTMTRTEFVNYANGLNEDGGTYHDIGMLWGARLSSPDGIFADNVNETAPNNGFVSRHLIFMTDGILDIGDQYYSAYGLERHDQKIGTGDETQASTNHITRFLAVCEAAKAKGVRLWVIAFATNLNDDLNACASPDSAFVSTNAAQLNQNFTEIAASIADLRLSQ